VKIAGDEERYALMPRHTFNLSPQTCMDVLNQSKDAGTRVVQWECWWGWNQRWSLEGIN
jgi:hypothetical protein